MVRQVLLRCLEVIVVPQFHPATSLQAMRSSFVSKQVMRALAKDSKWNIMQQVSSTFSILSYFKASYRIVSIILDSKVVDLSVVFLV